MKGVYIFGAVFVVIAAVAVFGLVYAKVAQKMFTRSNKKELK